jgi:hypothetical protein
VGSTTATTATASSTAAEGVLVPSTVTGADRVVADAIGRIRTTVESGVPGLESRIEDPELGSIRVLVAARPGETIRAELVARDPAAAIELTAALDRALAAGASLPTGVDLRIRAEGGVRATAAEAGLGSPTGDPRHGSPQPGGGQQRHDDVSPWSSGRDGPSSRPDPDIGFGRRHRSDPIIQAAPAAQRAARSGSALDVRA